MIPAAL